MIGTIGKTASWIGSKRALRGAKRGVRGARVALGEARDAVENVPFRHLSSPQRREAATSAHRAAKRKASAKARRAEARVAHRGDRKEIVGGIPGKMAVGGAIGMAAVAGAASEAFNPEGYAGDVTEDLTGSRDFQAQMFGAAVRTQFTSGQPRMGRPGRRRPQAPPGDIVFGMYNLR